MADLIDRRDVNRYLTQDAEESALTEFIASAIEAIQNITGRSWSDSTAEREEVFGFKDTMQ